MKQNLPDLIQQIRDEHPNVTHWDLWTMDDHRSGLKPILGTLGHVPGSVP